MNRFGEIRAAIRAARSPNFIHARSRSWGGQWIAYFYHRDPTSPSGKIMAAGIDDATGTEILRRAGRTSPLSPTEGL